MAYRIVITQDARDQLDAIYDYIAFAASPVIALGFTHTILDHVAKLADFPQIGTPRDDLRAGLRTITHRRRVTIAFMVEDTAVVVVGFFYGGRDFESLLRNPSGD